MGSGSGQRDTHRQPASAGASPAARHASALPALAAAGLVVALLAGCGNAIHPSARVAGPVAVPQYAATTPPTERDPNIYPAAVRRAFIRACERGGTSPDRCSCTFVALRQRLNARQFVELFRKTPGREPGEVRRAAHACGNS